MSHALVVFLHDGQLGFDKHCVILFSSEADAMEFVIARLSHYGEVHRENDVIFSSDRLERFESKEAALEAYQDGLGISEYFHLVAVQ